LIGGVKAGVAAVSDWFGLRKKFTARGQPHELYFIGKGASARLVVASKVTEIDRLLATGGDLEKQMLESGDPGRIQALSGARLAHRLITTAQKTLIRTPDNAAALNQLTLSLESLSLHLGVMGVELVADKPLKEGQIVILLGQEGKRKRTWPIEVVSIIPGQSFDYVGHGGRGFSKQSGTKFFSRYTKTWRFKESDADLHIEEHHKIPWENQDHITHPLVQLSKIDLYDDKRNKMWLGGHRSRHSDEYHRSISGMLWAAYSRVQRGEVDPDQAIEGVMKAIERDIASGALRPYADKDVWIP
jgi:hypothetical protein